MMTEMILVDKTMLEQALAALEFRGVAQSWVRHKAATALRAELTWRSRVQPQEPVQEPVYWEVRCAAHPRWMRVDEQQFGEYTAHGWEGQKLYTAPPKAEPVQEPFGYLWPTGRHPEFRFTQQRRDGVDGMPLYTAPPRAKPLTKQNDNERALIRHLHEPLREIERQRDQLLAALKWYVETDEVNDEPGNEFWLEGRERARAAIKAVEQQLSLDNKSSF